MKQNAFLAGSLALLLAAAAPVVAQTGSSQQPGSSQPGGGRAPRTVVVSEATSVIATVEKIDRKNREVTLKGPKGNTVQVKVGENAPYFDKLKKGDRIKADYYESTALSLRKQGELAPTGEESRVFVQPAQPGQGPKRTMINTKQVTATVQSIDYQNRLVTLKGPEGNLVTLKVDPSVQNFNQVKQGDQVVATFTEALALSLAPE